MQLAAIQFQLPMSKGYKFAIFIFIELEDCMV